MKGHEGGQRPFRFLTFVVQVGRNIGHYQQVIVERQGGIKQEVLLCEKGLGQWRERRQGRPLPCGVVNHAVAEQEEAIAVIPDVDGGMQSGSPGTV